MQDQIATLRAFLATPAGVRRIRSLMIGQGLSYQAAVGLVAVDVLGSIRAESLAKIVAEVVREIPRIAA